METKHTPGPWSINEWPQKDNRISIGAKGTPLIAYVPSRDVSYNEQAANAEFIVLACNNHEELLTECKHLREMLAAVSARIEIEKQDRVSHGKGNIFMLSGLHDDIRKLIARADAVVAKIEGEQA
jgi:hypothetical protein